MFMIQIWLKYIVQNTKNREVIEKYYEIKEFSYHSKEENEKRQLDKLNRLLNHTYKNIPFYPKLQKDLDYILVKIVSIKEIDYASLDVVVEKIKQIMGNECKVEFVFLDEIPKIQTGKYIFTISEVKD